MEHRDPRPSTLRARRTLSSPEGPAAQLAGVTANDDGGACVVVFIAGARERVEEALREARALYPDRDFALIAEPQCQPWLAEDARTRVFLVPQPFHPLGRSATELRRTLIRRKIDACILIVTGAGQGNLRFRLFALRLPATGFHLLPRSVSGGSSRVLDRVSFARYAGAAVLRWIRTRSPFDAVLLIVLARILGVARRGRPSPRTSEKREVVHLIPTVGMGGAQRQLSLFLKHRSLTYNHRLLVLSSDDRFSVADIPQEGMSIVYLDSVEEFIRRRLVEGPDSRRRRLRWRWPLFVAVRSCFPICGQVLTLSLVLRHLDPRPDVVHCWLLLANVIGPVAARLSGVPRVITSVRNIQSQVNYNYYDPRWQRAHERATAPLADVILANAPTVALDYRAFARIPSHKIVTVPNGIEPNRAPRLTPDQRASRRLALGVGPDTFVVGAVARLAKEKDFETFLRTVALAREHLPSLRAVIVGEGPLRTELEALAVSLKLGNGIVRFLGERSNVVDIVQCYDAFLLTSVIEGMPNAVMESQLLGVPVVATRAGGTVDIIRDGETGLLAPIGDAKALAAALVRILTVQSLRERITLAAREQMQHRFTVEIFVRRTEDVYRQLLEQHPSRPLTPCVE
jgi:glycosyltransferase involved in cell wall biosynthesis